MYVYRIRILECIRIVRIGTRQQATRLCTECMMKNPMNVRVKRLVYANEQSIMYENDVMGPQGRVRDAYLPQQLPSFPSLSAKTIWERFCVIVIVSLLTSEFL